MSTLSIAAFLTNRTDHIGMISSALCIVHCAVTPFFMMSQVFLGTIGLNHELWGGVSFLFLIISLFAMILTIRHSSTRWLQVCFVLTWVILTILIFNEYFEYVHLPFDLTYFPAIGLIALHVVNRRQCRCREECCNETVTTN